MQTANIMLSLNAGNDVPKYGVSAAEIAVLIAIHGESSVQNIEPLGDKQTITIDGDTVKWTNRVELERLHRIYGRAKDGEDRSIVAALFPGAGARVFETIDELGLPAEFFKPTARATAPVAEPVDEVEDDVPEVDVPITPPPAQPDPLDHDGNGKKGGAKKPKAAQPAENDGIEDMPAEDPLFT